MNDSEKGDRQERTALPERSEVSQEFQWKTEHIFQTDKDWEDAIVQLEKHLRELGNFQGRLGESAQKLLGCLQLRDEIDCLIGKIYIYAGLKNDQDTRNSKYQAFRDKAGSLLAQVKEKNSFFEPEILSIPEDEIWSMVKGNKELKIYRHYLENLIRMKSHVLPPEQEKLLAMASEVNQGPYNIFSMFNNADLKFPYILDENNQKIEVTKGRFNRLMQSTDRNVRKNAYDALYGTYQNWTNTLSVVLSTSVKKNIFNAKARGYPNPLEAALHEDNIPASVYSNVIDSIKNNLDPLHRYMELRKKMLGLTELMPWDLFVPLIHDMKFEITFPQSLKQIKKALQPLESKYISVLKDGFTNGWIDVYENLGKRSGAYSWSTHGIHPFILLNYNDTMDDLFTVAHELGHALHSYFTHNTQPAIYSNYTTFVAEVASTLNEALLIDHLIKSSSDPREKFYLLNEYADQIKGTVYIQTLFAEFERHIHDLANEGEALTASLLNQINRDHYIRYFGPAFTLDSLYEINWCRIPHFYYNFYVYKYVTGFSAAIAISQKILAGDKKTRNAYLEFLSRGSSDYSINLLKEAGVDMTSPQPIEATVHLMNSLVEEMEALQHRI